MTYLLKQPWKMVQTPNQPKAQKSTKRAVQSYGILKYVK